MIDSKNLYFVSLWCTRLPDEFIQVFIVELAAVALVEITISVLPEQQQIFLINFALA